MTSSEVRNPVITIAPDQTYDITLTVTTPAGSDTKCVKSMIMGSKPVPENTGVENAVANERDLLLLPGCVVNAGDALTFVPRMLDGVVDVVVYDSKGSVVARGVGVDSIVIETAGFAPAVYFYMASDEAGYKETGKLLVK